MLRAILSFFGVLFSWATIGLVMAAFGIGAIFWMYGAGLPNHEQLAKYEPKTISYVYSGEGRLMDEFAAERRIFTPVDEIPPVVRGAFISAEDKNFYLHAGYDPLGIVKALFDAVQGGRLRGASTITQQVMKNFLLSSDRSAERKIKEIILASRIEKTLNKDQILELYLNEIFLGQNSYGVTAAAQTYFNKPLTEITPAEAAYLASLPKAPSSYHPVREKDRAITRRNFVLKEMAENGYLTEDEATAAAATDLLTVQSGDYVHYKDALPARDFFTDEIRRQLSEVFGEDEFFGGGLAIRATVNPELQLEAARALRKGLEDYDRQLEEWRGPVARIETVTLTDIPAIREALSAVEAPRDIEGWHLALVVDVNDNAARVVIDGVEEVEGGHAIPVEDLEWARRVDEDGKKSRKPKKATEVLATGDVVFVRREFGPVEGTKKGDTNPEMEFKYWSLRQVPEVQGAFMAMDTQTGRVLAMQGGFSYQQSVFNRATQATRQPGSSFKPFVYAAALDSGFTPATIIIDAPIEIRTPQGLWRPKNASNKFYGPTPMRTGIERSRNLMTIRLAQAVGMDTVAQYAERFGVYSNMGLHLANALGSEETTLFKMVAAYAMFANGGERVIPTMVDRVQDRRGQTVYRHDRRDCVDCMIPSIDEGFAPEIRTNRARVMDPFTAYQLTSMMRGVVERGTAARTVNLGVPVAGKTGTTNDARDVWFVGFTPNIVAGCYIGYDIPKPLGRGAGGGTMCGPVFNDFMKKAIETYGSAQFKVPEGGAFVKIDRYSGARLSDGAAGENVVAEYFRAGEEPVGGALAVIDGGFAMGSNLPVFERGENDNVEEDTGVEVTTTMGVVKKIPKRATFGSLTAGGLY